MSARQRRRPDLIGLAAPAPRAHGPCRTWRPGRSLVGAVLLGLAAASCARIAERGPVRDAAAPAHQSTDDRRAASLPEQSERVAARAQQFRGDRPVLPQPDGAVVAEAEEFQVTARGAWQARDWGENYYAATFANTFLSRKAFLGAPAQCERSEARITVEVPRAGRYLALVRYEAAYRFETQFRVSIEQGGRTGLDRLYGARGNPKVWAFDRRITDEVPAGENVVWEGHDAAVDLEAGLATITLTAGRQEEPAARRNVDLVMLTTDEAQVRERIEKESYLPLDGMLTQAGDVYLKVHNAGGSALTVTVHSGTEHSPYWVHIRRWPPSLASETAAGQRSGWIEVGSLLDALSDGQWHVSAVSADADRALDYRLEFGVKNAAGAIESIATIASRDADVWLAYDANTRYTRRVRTDDVVLYDLLAHLKAHPVPGAAPRRTIVYASTFAPRRGDERYSAAAREFVDLMGLTRSLVPTPSLPWTSNTIGNPRLTGPSGYLDLHGAWRDGLEPTLAALVAGGAANTIRTVSVGDEIALDVPAADDHDGFRAWARARGLAPAEVVPEAGDDWSRVRYRADATLPTADQRAFYYSRLYAQAYGIERLTSQTERIKPALPRADVGANYSPHPGYLGEAHKYIGVFRRGALTMPWGEDYAWQIPIGTQQISFLQLDLFRAGIRYTPARAIHFYVMPHWPGNTVESWRRMWYGALGHGMKIANLYELRPVQAAYSENHVSLPRMYIEIRRAIYELSSFEDIVQDGAVRPGRVALWYSETGDAWRDHARPYAAGKRLLYAAVGHQQVALDVVDEEDALRGTLGSYQALYLTDPHVSRAASRAIADWVRRGGRLFATARAGMLDEFDAPNRILRELLGVEADELDTPADSRVALDKRDLPFAAVFDTASWQRSGRVVDIPVIGARSRFTATGARVTGTFADGSPAVATRTVGSGTATYAGFLPGLSYFKPAIPRRPVDRGTTEDSMAHLVPTQFDPGARALIGSAVEGLSRDVECSNALVQASVIESASGIAIPLVNWSGAPIKDLRVTLAARDLRNGRISLAGGGAVRRLRSSDPADRRATLILDLAVADALILR